MSAAVSSEMRMAQQILRNFAIHGEDEAVTRTVAHIVDFWEPRMIARLIDQAQGEAGPCVQALAARLAARRKAQVSP